MNERIKELASQIDWSTDTTYTELTKFAELIVKECIEQAHAVGDLRGVNDDMIFGADTAALRISKHFGVSE